MKMVKPFSFALLALVLATGCSFFTASSSRLVGLQLDPPYERVQINQQFGVSIVGKDANGHMIGGVAGATAVSSNPAVAYIKGGTLYTGTFGDADLTLSATQDGRTVSSVVHIRTFDEGARR